MTFGMFILLSVIVSWVGLFIISILESISEKVRNCFIVDAAKWVLCGVGFFGFVVIFMAIFC